MKKGKTFKEYLEKEDKKSRFKRVAEYRVNLVLKDINKLDHLKNLYLYEYDLNNIKKIFKTIRDELTRTELRLSNKDNIKNKGEFSL